MATNLVGYLYSLHTPWSVPFLHVDQLGGERGINVFWLDAIPWVTLVGKAFHSITGVVVNFYGFYLFLCFSLPGMALTTLVIATGQRSLAGALAATVLGEATPYLLFRWGHSGLCAQFLLIFALTLYVLSLRQPRNLGVSSAWLALLGTAVLTQIYIFAMVAAIWGAALLQRRLDGRITDRRGGVELVAVVGTVGVLLGLIGAWQIDKAMGGVGYIGEFSMNLASPFTPQMSGIIGPLAHYRIGMGSQYEGFAYVGFGVILLTVFSVKPAFYWLRANARSHAVLLSVLLGFVLFSLSNNVYLGSHLILTLPLPSTLSHALAAFRSSGRFFWPVGYALTAGCIVIVLQQFRRSTALVLLTVASIAQLVDAQPLRGAIAVSAREPRPSILDRAAATELVAKSRGVRVYPSFACIKSGAGDLVTPRHVPDELRQANMEFQLLAARAGLPINSVYSARPSTDCAAETEVSHDRLETGVLYIYLAGQIPVLDQLGNRRPDDVCGHLNWMLYCEVP